MGEFSSDGAVDSVEERERSETGKTELRKRGGSEGCSTMDAYSRQAGAGAEKRGG